MSNSLSYAGRNSALRRWRFGRWSMPGRTRRLLALERFGRLDPEPASRGAERGEEPHDAHHDGRAGKQQACPSPECLSVLRPVEQERQPDPERHSDCDLSKRPAEDAAQKPAGLGAERGADRDLATSLRDGEGHERVDPCGRQKNHTEQRDTDRHRRGRQASPLQTVGIPEGDHLDRERRVERRGDLPELSCERRCWLTSIRTARRARLPSTFFSGW